MYIEFSVKKNEGYSPYFTILHQPMPACAFVRLCVYTMCNYIHTHVCRDVCTVLVLPKKCFPGHALLVVVRAQVKFLQIHTYMYVFIIKLCSPAA